MVNLRSALAVVVFAPLVVACSSNNKGSADAPIIIIPDAPADAPPPIDAPPDAPSYDFSCLSHTTAPTTGADPILIAGLAEEGKLMGLTPMIVASVGANIDTCKAGAPNCNGGNKLNTTSSIAGGVYTTSTIATGGTPLDAYLVVNNDGDHTSYEFSARPFTATADVPILLLSTTLDPAFTILNGSLNPADGIVLTLVLDCAGARVANATLSVKQNGTDVGNTMSGSALPMAEGGFITFDVPPGDTDISASYMGMNFLSRTIKSFASGTSLVAIKPGYQ